MNNNQCLLLLKINHSVVFSLKEDNQFQNFWHSWSTTASIKPSGEKYCSKRMDFHLPGLLIFVTVANEREM